jgi:hypothetical protein
MKPDFVPRIPGRVVRPMITFFGPSHTLIQSLRPWVGGPWTFGQNGLDCHTSSQFAAQASRPLQRRAPFARVLAD